MESLRWSDSSIFDVKWDVNVLFVIESLGRGGAEQALVNSLPVLQRRGHRCEVAALFPPYDLAQPLEDAGIIVHRLNVSHRWNLWQGIRKMVALCRAGQFDVVHGNLFFAGLYVSMSRPLAPKPRRVVTFHNLGYESYPATTLWKKVRKAADGWLMRNWIDARMAVSLAVARHYEAHLGVKGTVLIPNAVTVTDLNSTAGSERLALRNQYRVLPAEFFIVTPARLVMEKGHRVLLEALVILREKGLRPKILLLGRGPLAEEISRQIASLNLQDQVTLRGTVPHATLLALIQAADACVLSSTHEGFPLAPGEAMALEKPVIATRVGGLDELLEDGVSGLLVPPRDPDALAEAIARLMGDPSLRERLGRAGKLRIQTRFSPEVVAARWEEFYKEVLSGRPGN